MNTILDDSMEIDVECTSSFRLESNTGKQLFI